jgi:hypothetical protein
MGQMAFEKETLTLTGCHRAGWCYFEYCTASLIKNAELLWDMSNWTGPRTYDSLRTTMKIGRVPPMSPPRVESEMRRRIAEGSLSFSYSADIEPV